MSSISSINSSILSSYFTTGTSSSSRNSKSDAASAMAEDLFAQLDTTGKGYIEESDLVSAFSQVSSSDSTSSTSTSAEDVFAKLDSDSDGKVTEDELTSGLEALAAALDTQLNQMRMSAAMSGSSESGYTQDELEAQLSEIGSTDSARSGLISAIVDNFEAADTDSDGKVSNEEAMAFDQNLSAMMSSSSTSSAASASSSTSTSDSGFTLSELEAQLSEIESTDSTRSDLLTRIIANFDTADTNQDGTVSNAEAMAYDQSTTATSSAAVAATGSSSGSSSSSSDSSNSSQTSSELAILKRIMDLMQSYASTGQTSSSTVSASA